MKPTRPLAAASMGSTIPSGALPPATSQARLSSKNMPPNEPMPLHQNEARPVALRTECLEKDERVPADSGARNIVEQWRKVTGVDDVELLASKRIPKIFV